MKLIFAYERLDGQYAVCQVDDHSDICNALEENNKIRISNANKYTFDIIDKKDWEELDCPPKMKCSRTCSYSSVHFFEDEGEAWVCLTLPHDNKGIEMTLNLFNNKIVGITNSITIKNVAEYINCIEHIRLISLAVHIIAILTFDLSHNKNTINKGNIKSYIHHLQKEIINERVRLFNCQGTSCQNGLSNYKIDDNNPIILTVSEIINASQDASFTDSSKYEIGRSFALYRAGSTFGYYRGIGRTIYPDVPSIFRDANKREEDRWYREMKTQFQNDLEKKPYLDRLGMLQHYELPTRMLDVTSSPLVALYMTANTIYTGDKNQSDTGEIVVYYDGIVNNDNVCKEQSLSLDCYGSDIAYIHDGKSYDSSIVLALAALAKLKYENKERMRRVICTLKHLIDLKWGREPSKYTAMMELINRCFHANGDCFEQHYYFTADESNSIIRTYKACLEGKELIRAEDICDILWDITVPDSTTVFPVDAYTSKEELHTEYLHCILSYRYILSTIRRENPAFKDHINIFDLIKCFHVKMGRTNDRIQAQAGSFIICGLDPDYIKNHMLSSRTPGMVRFFVSNKREIMRELNSLGINDSTMLPDIAHHAACLKGRTSR